MGLQSGAELCNLKGGAGKQVPHALGKLEGLL
jgi:hypothetical protein